VDNAELTKPQLASSKGRKSIGGSFVWKSWEERGSGGRATRCSKTETVGGGGASACITEDVNNCECTKYHLEKPKKRSFLKRPPALG